MVFERDQRMMDLGAPPSAVMTVDLDAIALNYAALCNAAPGAQCAAVVKADAYGLGIAEVAPVLARAGCRWLFVAQLEEGIRLRTILGDGATIGVLNGLVAGGERLCRRYDLTPVINDARQFISWSQEARNANTRLDCILQLDTGMSRFGFSRPDWEALLAGPHPFEHVRPILLMTHLACADTPENPENAAQRICFEVMTSRLPDVPRSLAASSAIFLGQETHFDMVRPGAALYGVNPCPGRPNPMRSVLRLQARVVQMREVPAETAVGYGAGTRTQRPSRLATIAVGYADGLARSVAGKGAAWVGDARLPIMGPVSMDSIIVDASDLAAGALLPGDLVDLVGPACDVDCLARAAGTIGYEILTSLGPRYARVYVSSRDGSR